MNGGNVKRDAGDALISKVYQPIADNRVVKILELIFARSLDPHSCRFRKLIEITEPVVAKEFKDGETTVATK